jgi:hypothetical protein
MDYNTKQALWNIQPARLPRGQAFPLEPVYVSAGLEKIMADMGHHVQFLAHCTLARTSFHQLKILEPTAFNKVDWEMVYQMLHKVPRMFQQWVCKQVMGIAGTMEWDKSVVRKCPSCMQQRDTCAHLLFCEHVGRVTTLHHTVDLLDLGWRRLTLNPISWTASQNTHIAEAGVLWWRSVMAWENHFRG